MSNDPFKLARMAGYYKGVQSAGSAISFGMDAVSTPFIGEILLSWLLLLVSLPLCALVLWYTKETNYEDEKITRVEDVSEGAMEVVAVPKGHHIGEHTHALGEEVREEEKV
jgi:hypothetical protein